MLNPSPDYIRHNIADSGVIYQRGVSIYKCGSCSCSDFDLTKGLFIYDVDGNYGDYTTQIQLNKDKVGTSCDCPYPGDGCKHVVACLLDVHDRLGRWKGEPYGAKPVEITPPAPYLSAEEIKAHALDDRMKRAVQEEFKIVMDDMLKGEHLVETSGGRQYTVTLHCPETGRGHCSCPDFLTNRLGTCKHMLHMLHHVRKEKDFSKRIAQEIFPFIDVYWDSGKSLPRVFYETILEDNGELAGLLAEYFREDGLFAKSDPAELLTFFGRLNGNKKVRIQEMVFQMVEEILAVRQLEELAQEYAPTTSVLKTKLYPYQEQGVRFALYKRSALIGDEMGLGKTLQAIVASIMKKEIFGFQRVLVVTLSSLKEQWRREIERFTDEKAVIISGGAAMRRRLYETDNSLFKITNYEAVLRDITVISAFKPDLVILDEAQRIKNLNTKTADAVKRIPRKHALVLTGTPLENKLDDVYSIIQFLDPHLLSPLWQFAADHFMLSRDKKGKVLGYRNLDVLHKRLKGIVIRRRKEEVLSDLPEQVVNNYYLDMTDQQKKMHAGYAQLLLPLLNKKFLTPVDVKRIQELLTSMRMVCDSTYLIDRRTNMSPKLQELEGILDELVCQNGRKVVVFSEWRTMNFLIAKYLSDAGIPFVELSGKVPVHKRQLLIDEFTNNPECKVFLSTDAGGVGLNLQAADCVINFELPWNPARVNQRIGRVNRIGQKSRCINVVNLIMKDSIEEKILTGIKLKTELFEGVFDGGVDAVEFSHEKRTELLNRLKDMLGEEPLPPTAESRPSEEIPEDAPHYLNPQVLQDKGEVLSYDAEENDAESAEIVEAGFVDTGKDVTEYKTESSVAQSPEKVEEVLNSGMQFLSGIFEMATGKKLVAAGNNQNLISIDRQTGEVTLKFRLPGF